MEELFKNPKYCYGQIAEARKIFGNNNTTMSQYDAMEKALGLMYLYCPENLTTIVQATMNEATIRRSYFRFPD